MGCVDTQDTIVCQVSQTLGDAFPGEEFEEDLFAVVNGTGFQNDELVELGRAMFAKLLAGRAVENAHLGTPAARIGKELEVAFFTFIQVDYFFAGFIEMEVLEGTSIRGHVPAIHPNDGN